ncbi:hypothetical protein J8L70_00005 [Pseudoalteromonas sp. MMG010]|uniref:hypothetical protein n=1 Tax=Pseudoalteromonas sp. MMG010 TaxID=2822685 RepID=UPI001B3A6CF0|nr:hypothetical protein [Pseudoalteromonas sp. MMG010]MBQ4831625.1 hypothetical protein [Pseudoalteromonas sp. MMG010]
MKPWRVREEEHRILLGKPDEFTFKRWKRGNVTALECDVLVRIPYVIGIYRNLGILFSERAQAKMVQ